jgi:hypothetical protein
MANGNPGFTFGQIPTPAQWNALFTTKVDAEAGTADNLTLTSATLASTLQASASYANDAAAAIGGVAVGQFYRNGNVVMIRMS